MTGSCAALQRKFSKLDEFAVINVDVCLGLCMLGNNTLACRYLPLDHTRPGHMVGMHVSVY